MTAVFLLWPGSFFNGAGYTLKKAAGDIHGFTSLLEASNSRTKLLLELELEIWRYIKGARSLKRLFVIPYTNITKLSGSWHGFQQFGKMKAVSTA